MAASQMTSAVRIGLMGDIQYANADDGSGYHAGRHYRNSLVVTEWAVQAFNNGMMDAVVTLGDMIDSKCATGCGSLVGLERVTSTLSRLNMPRYDVVGNHELYNFRREDLPNVNLNLQGWNGKTYHSVRQGNWDLIFLDAFELSVIGMDDHDPRYQEALRLLRAHHPNADRILADPDADWFEGLLPENTHWLPCGGALSSEQLDWLRRTLIVCKAAGRKAIIFSHQPIFVEACEPTAVLWNCDQVLAILHGFTDTVCAVFAGHDHGGGYATDGEGLHHVTMSSPMVAAPGSECWDELELLDGKARLQCAGRAVCESRTRGQGRHYPQLDLAMGACNTPV
jgi:manganese-dependent ADP-ribose/CDP-alcohol diphosphatase